MKKISYSFHARKRISERELSEEEIKEVVEKGFLRISRRGKEFFYEGKIVVLDVSCDLVITAYKCKKLKHKKRKILEKRDKKRINTSMLTDYQNNAINWFLEGLKKTGVVEKECGFPVKVEIDHTNRTVIIKGPMRGKIIEWKTIFEAHELSKEQNITTGL